MWLIACLGGLLTAAFFTVPFAVTVEAQALIQTEPERTCRIIVSEPGGFVVEVPVRDGQEVRAGEVLAVLTNPKLEIRLRVNEADRALRQRQEDAQVVELADPGDSEDETRAHLLRIEYELRAVEREQKALREQRERLTLRAPCDGTVMGLNSAEIQGKWLEKGMEVCRVGDTRMLRAVFVVDPSDHRLIPPDGPARVRVHGRGSRNWPAVVTGVAPVDARQVPPQLSAHAGGELVTEQDPQTRVERPRAQAYVAAVRLESLDATLSPGLLGRVKVEGPARTCWWRVQRYLARTINWGL